MNTFKPNVVVIGGGMITEVQILPSLYQLQRLGVINEISISALNGAPLKKLANSKTLSEAFPGQGFMPYPDFTKEDPEKAFPDMYKTALDDAGENNIALIALPDQMHYGAIKEALERNMHIVSVKPLVLNYKQSLELEKLAEEKNLFIGVEYHKRADDRSLIARRRYRSGLFGEFKMGQAHLVEPWYYRDSNFQNWCTVENSDMFSYIACHYIDLVHFITGLLPSEISVYGIIDDYPNGNKGYLYTDGRVIWENGAVLNVQNAIGYPNIGPGGNSQGMMLFFEGSNDGGFLFHQDQYRGVKHSMIQKGNEPGDTYYVETSPDYFQLIEYGGKGLEPVGYGYRSIRKLIEAAISIASAPGVQQKTELIKKIDSSGIVATPANSFYNELVMEAGRMSITNQGKPVTISYKGTPSVSFK